MQLLCACFPFKRMLKFWLLSVQNYTRLLYVQCDYWAFCFPCSGQNFIVKVYAVKRNFGKSYVNTVVFSIYTMHMWKGFGAKMIEHVKIDRFGVCTRYKILSRPDEVIYGPNRSNLAINRGASIWRINIKHIRDLYTVMLKPDIKLKRRNRVKNKPPTFPCCLVQPSWKAAFGTVKGNNSLLTIQ